MTDLLIPHDAVASWAQVSDELWIATVGEQVVGRIELVEDRYVALDGRNVMVCIAGALEVAQSRFDEGPLMAAPITTMSRVRDGLRRVLRTRASAA
jgi:hypothetical protein